MSTIEPNTRGRDFVLGDVHGCFDTVETALGALSYDSQRDRLFSVGDLIDYGPRSADALEWIRERFTATARGNHEDMMLDFLVLGVRMSNDGGVWRAHWASGWFPSWGGRGRKGIGLDTLQNVRAEDPGRVKRALCALHGIGKATAHMLLMYCGNDDYVKGDVHVCRFVADALGEDEMDPREAERLVAGAAHVLGIAPRTLDARIWSLGAGAE